MSKTRSLVGNAADPKQVKFAERFEKRKRERLRIAFYNVLNTVDGRTVFAELIRRQGVFNTVFSTDALAMAYNAGRQDSGHNLQADLIDLDETLYQRMQAEEAAWAKKERDTIEAAHTARAEETNGDPE